MRPATIAKHVAVGTYVVYKIRILRGYLWGWRIYTFIPGHVDIAKCLECFRRDEAPYEKPTWHLFNSQQEIDTWRETL